MPWSNQGGGPWGSGGGSKGPWGSGQQPSGPTPPDLEEFLRRSQDRLRTVLMLPGGSLDAKGLSLILLAARERVARGKLAIEHVMPRKWHTYWPLQEGRAEADRDRIFIRSVT
jgi:hypothetical protein